MNTAGMAEYGRILQMATWQKLAELWQPGRIRQNSLTWQNLAEFSNLIEVGRISVTWQNLIT